MYYWAASKILMIFSVPTFEGLSGRLSRLLCPRYTVVHKIWGRICSTFVDHVCRVHLFTSHHDKLFRYMMKNFFFDSSDMMFAFSLEAQVKRNCIAARVRKIGVQYIPCYPILEIRFPYGLVLTFQSILHPALLVKERHSILNHDLQNEALFFQVTFSHLPMINHFQFPLSR